MSHPTIIISGRTGRNYTAHVLAFLLREAGHNVGLATSNGVFIGDRLMAVKETASSVATEILKSAPDLDVVVRSLSPKEISRDGLPQSSLSLSALLNTARTVKDVASEKSKQAVTDVLNATTGCSIVGVDDPFIQSTISVLSSHQLILVSRDINNRVLQSHIDGGGDAVVLERQPVERVITLYAQGTRQGHINIQDIPACQDAQGSWRVRSCLFAVALAHGYGLKTAQIFETLKKLRYAHFSALVPLSPHSSNRISALWTGKDISKAVGGTWTSDPAPISGTTYYRGHTVQGDLGIATRAKQWKSPKYKDTSLDLGVFLKKGAVGVITDVVPTDAPKGLPLCLVKNTRKALDDLGRAARERFQGKVICVTGSVGKTSTKTALHHVLALQALTYGSRKNFNHGPGIPLSLSQTPADYDYGVYEFSVDLPGVAHTKSMIARPHVAIITQLQNDHIEFYGSMENLAMAKAQIFDGIAENGVAVLNRDMTFYTRIRAAAKRKGVSRIVSFGVHPSADVRLVDCKLGANGSQIKASVHGKMIEYTHPIAGQHMVMNSLCVLAAVEALGADWKKAADDFKTLPSLPNRTERHTIPISGGSFLFIDDAFSANPESMKSAIELLGLMKPGPKGRRIAILGEIKELGDPSPELHAGLSIPLKKSAIDLVFTIGDDMVHLRNKLPKRMQGVHGKTSDDLTEGLTQTIRAGDVVLVKGSRRTLESSETIVDTLLSIGVGQQSSKIKQTPIRRILDNNLGTKKLKVRGTDRGAGVRLDILFAGDTSFGENYQAQYEQRGLRNILSSKGYAYPLKNMNKVLGDANLVIANLETPLTDLTVSPFKDTKSYVHWSDVEKAPRHLLNHNIGLCSLANNHAFDYGEEGFLQTLDILDANRMRYFGGGRTAADALKPLVIQGDIGAHQIDVAIISAYEFSKTADTKFKTYAQGKNPGLAPLDDVLIAQEIKRLKKENPDTYVVIFPHWGPNYKKKTKTQSNMAERLLKVGADLIIGHGAHMMQSIDKINGHWILYSIGNFMFNSLGRYQKMNAPPFSLLAKLIIEEQHGMLNKRLQLLPIMTDNRLNGYQTRFVTEPEFFEIWRLLRDSFSSPETFDKEVRRGQENGNYLLEFNL